MKYYQYLFLHPVQLILDKHQLKVEKMKYSHLISRLSIL